MSIRLNFCRSVPPEFLWSFFLLTTTYVSPYENDRESKNIGRMFLLKPYVFLQTNTGFLTTCVILRGFACYRNHWLSHHQWTICGVQFQRSLTHYTSRTYLIFVFFLSTSTIFGPIFLHTKARKSQQNRFRDKTASMATIKILQQNKSISPHNIYSPHFLLLLWRNLSCGEIYPHNRLAPYFSILMWRHLSCEKFLHLTDFSTFLHKTHFALHLSRGVFCLCDRSSSHFSCGEISPHYHLSYGKISPHDRFFLHKHRL